MQKLALLSIGSYSPFEQPDSKVFTVFMTDHNSESYHEDLKILLTNSNLLNRNPQLCATIKDKRFPDLSTLITKYTKKLRLSPETKAFLFASSEFPFCPQFTHFKAMYLHIHDSVPKAFMKAVKSGKLPNLRRIDLIYCTLNDCEWLEVPEFSCSLSSTTMSDSSQMQKLLFNVTEVTYYEGDIIDRLIKVRLEKLSVLNVGRTNTHNLQCLNDVLKQGFLPNLSKLQVWQKKDKMQIINTFLYELDLNSISKLEKLALRLFAMLEHDLKILSDKLTSLHLTELDMWGSRVLTGSLSVLFTHSLPSLNTLILSSCDLNSGDLQSLAKAEVEGKLPKLKHLDISENKLFDIKASDLFTHSAQWNRLTTFVTDDENVLNVEPRFLTSLEELIVNDRAVQSITRRWPCLKIITLRKYDDHKIVPCIVDGVERGMFPSLRTEECTCTSPTLIQTVQGKYFC